MAEQTGLEKDLADMKNTMRVYEYAIQKQEDIIDDLRKNIGGRLTTPQPSNNAKSRMYATIMELQIFCFRAAHVVAAALTLSFFS